MSVSVFVSVISVIYSEIRKEKRKKEKQLNIFDGLNAMQYSHFPWEVPFEMEWEKTITAKKNEREENEIGELFFERSA